jgi:sterol 3beta-glucosyltransferase
MRITLISYGTRGDVQPMLSLAWVLRERGHEVLLLAPKNVESWVARTGVPFAALPVDAQALLSSPPAQRMLAKGDIWSFFKWLAGAEQEYRVGMRQAVIEACADADAIVADSLTQDRAAAVGAARKIPILPLYLYPVPPSSAFPSPFITTKNLGPLNRLTHKLLLDMLWKASQQDVDAMRATLGIAGAPGTYTREAQRTGAPCLLAYSAEIFPRPADYGPNNVVTGSFVMPPALQRALGECGLPEHLGAWLKRGPAPVFLGFGSMPVLDVEAMLHMTRAALERVGMRAVIGAGWSAVPSGGDDMLYRVDNIDYAALFESCSAAVHHGGSGTTYASLRAGLPTLICSVFADQPFWGTRCRALGVGGTMPFKRLGAQRLADGLRKLLSEPTPAKARALGARLRAERALEKAVEVIERVLPRAPHPV